MAFDSYHVNKLSETQRNNLNKLASVCTDYGLNWVETKKDNLEVFTLVPPIVIPATFPEILATPTIPATSDPAIKDDKDQKRESLATMNIPPTLAQLVASAIINEKHKRKELRQKLLASQPTTISPKKPIPKTPQKLDLKRVPQPKTPEETVEKDFFGRTVTRKTPLKKLHPEKLLHVSSMIFCSSTKKASRTLSAEMFTSKIFCD